MGENSVLKKIQTDIIPLQENVQRNFKTWKEEKKQTVLSELKQIFDIGKCLCFRDKNGIHKARQHFIYANCLCPKENKILNFPIYHEQIFDRTSVILISEEEKKYFEEILSKYPGNV
jgi:hypothetical protein